MSDWTYQALVTSVHDGDTITVDLDMGMRVWQRGVHVRLAGINAPELKAPTKAAGGASRDALRNLIGGQTVTLISHSFEKYGRLLATVLVADDWTDINVNDWMLDNGHAVPYLIEP